MTAPPPVPPADDSSSLPLAPGGPSAQSKYEAAARIERTYPARAPRISTPTSRKARTPGRRTPSTPPVASRPIAAHGQMPRACSRSTFVVSRVVRMPKMRERSARLSARSLSVRGSLRRRGLCLVLGLALLVGAPSRAYASARRIALIHAQAELVRSVDIALYPWDITVVEVDASAPIRRRPTPPLPRDRSPKSKGRTR